MRLETARKYALSLPETTEEPHFEYSSFRVRGKIFTTVPDTGKHLHIRVDPDEGRALIEGDSAAYEQIWWGKRLMTDWVRVYLPEANASEVRELLADAWRGRAPKRVVAAYDASHR